MLWCLVVSFKVQRMCIEVEGYSLIAMHSESPDFSLFISLPSQKGGTFETLGMPYAHAAKFLFYVVVRYT